MRYSRLFTPITLNQVVLRNRIVSTAHAEVIADEHGLPGERYLRYYEERPRAAWGWPSAAAPASFRPTARKAGGARSTFPPTASSNRWAAWPRPCTATARAS